MYRPLPAGITIGDIVRSGFVRNYLINKMKLGIGVE